MFGGIYPLVGDLPAFVEAFKATAPFLVRAQEHAPRRTGSTTPHGR